MIVGKIFVSFTRQSRTNLRARLEHCRGKRPPWHSPLPSIQLHDTFSIKELDGSGGEIGAVESADILMEVKQYPELPLG